MCKTWNGKIWCREKMAILKYHCKIWWKFPDCGARTGIDRERWLLFPTGLWVVAGMYCSFSMVAWVVALISRRLLGTRELDMPRELQMTPRKMASASFVFRPPCVTFRLVVAPLHGALDSHPFFPSHVASGRCVLSAAAAGALAGVVSAFAEPSRWCVGAVLNVAWCAVCVSAAPNSWRIGGCAGCCRGCLTVFAVHTPLPTGRP